MTETSLTWNLQTTGVSGVQSDIQKISGAASQAHREIAKTPNVSGWRNGIGQIRNSFSGLFGDFTKLVGLAGVGFSFLSSKQEWSNQQSQLLQIRYAANMTKSEIQALSEVFRKQSIETGYAASELEKITQQLMDYGVAAKEAAPMATKIAGLAKLQGSTAEDVQQGYVASRGILGSGVSPEQTLAYFAELAGGAGVDEAVVSRVLARSGTTFASRGGLQGEEGFRALGGMLTVLANTYKGKPKEIESGMNMLADSLGDEKAIKGMRSLLNLGENEALPSLDIMFTKLATAIGTGGLTKETVLKQLPEQLAFLLLDSSRYIGSANDAMAGIVGDTNKLEEWLKEATTSDPFANAMNALKQSLIPVIEGLANGIAAHQDDIIAFAEWIGELGQWAVNNGKELIALFIGMKAVLISAGFLAAGPVGAAVTVGAVIGGSLAGGAAEVLGFGISDTSRIKGETEAIQLKSELDKTQLETAMSATTLEQSNMETAAYIAQRGGGIIGMMGTASRFAATPEEAMGLVRQAIQLNIQTTVTPDGVTTRATATQDGRDVSGQQIATN